MVMIEEMIIMKKYIMKVKIEENKMISEDMNSN
jgi:hypothetical protein